MPSSRTTVDVSGQRLRLSNLDKVLYPEAGFTKGDVIDYYRQVAPALLPRLRDRAATLIRFPDGVGRDSFFEKDVSRHAPDWLRTVALRSGADGSGSSTNHHVVIADLPTLVWTANLAALELHVPQWTVGPRGARHTPDLLVFDLDPGEPATIVECCRTAEWLYRLLRTDGLRPYAKTSGSKGLQLYCPVRTSSSERTSAYAKDLAQHLSDEHPDQVLAKMARAARKGKVFIDWSQNNPAKTTVAAYSLRARSHPTVSTPITWDEVRSCERPEDLRFTSTEVLRRLAKGDLLDDLHEDPFPL
ncbi:non-homologous end-joining DNA ligase [Parasphingorhabdus pacifica]